jgi:hypothetical protein
VPARNNIYPKERQNPTRIEDKTKKNKNMSARQKMFARRHLPEKKMFARRRKTKPRTRRCLPKKCFFQEERQKNQ